MKSLIIMIPFCVLLLSCTSYPNIISGQYHSKEIPSEYNLILRNDNTYSYLIGFKGTRISKCDGKWSQGQAAEKNILVLKCNNEDWLAGMSSTYMKDRINKFKILNNGTKLKNGKVILKLKPAHSDYNR